MLNRIVKPKAAHISVQVLMRFFHIKAVRKITSRRAPNRKSFLIKMANSNFD